MRSLGLTNRLDALAALLTGHLTPPARNAAIHSLRHGTCRQCLDADDVVYCGRCGKRGNYLTGLRR